MIWNTKECRRFDRPLFSTSKKVITRSKIEGKAQGGKMCERKTNMAWTDFWLKSVEHRNYPEFSEKSWAREIENKAIERKWVLYTIQCPSLHLVSFWYRANSPTYTIPFHLGQYGHCRIQMSINNIKIFLFNFWNFSENFSHLFA